MSSPSCFKRCLAIFASDLSYHSKRPLVAVWAFVMILTAWGLSSGTMQIASGDQTVGGTRAYITSEFAVSMQLTILTLLFHGFFVSVLAGMAIIQDEDWKLTELLLATPLRPWEYVWGKFAAVLATALGVLGIQLVAMMILYHLIPVAQTAEIRGVFSVWNYVKPAIVFAAPTMVFLAGLALGVGAWSRRPVMVFLLPVAIVLFVTTFLWQWSPSWLDPALERLLEAVDPAGYRWLNERFLKVDRGVAFYNTAAVPFDAWETVNRVMFVLLGLGCAGLAARGVSARVRGRAGAAWFRRKGRVSILVEDRDTHPIEPLQSLGMAVKRPGFWRGAWTVAHGELLELRSSAGLYLFIPLLFIQTISVALLDVGFLDTPFLVTSTRFAVRSLIPLSLCLAMLFVFYAADTIDRERTTRLASFASAYPIRTSSILLGKLAGLCVIATVVVLAVALGGVIAMFVQGRITPNLGIFALYWGVILVPTVLVWIAFLFAVHGLAQSRYAVYAAGTAVLLFTGYRLLTGQINWVGNWPMWDAVSASDISVFELDRIAVVLSRVGVLGLAIFLGRVAVQAYRRREIDAARLLGRTNARGVLLELLRLLPWAAAPIVAAGWLGWLVHSGREGGVAKKSDKDYWRRNVATFTDARTPDLVHVELNLALFPQRSGYQSRGTYELVNHDEKPFRQVLLTGGRHWRRLSWTLDGKDVVPGNRAGLYVFTPPGGTLKPGERMVIGFRHEGEFPAGIGESAARAREFILPSSVVITGFEPTIAPVLGFREDIGIDDENRSEAREYPDDFHEGRTDTFLGARYPFTTRITIEGPADFTLNSVGIKRSDTVVNERRTVVWESDHPVELWNVIAGRYVVDRKERTAIYHDKRHSYNIPEMHASLEAALKYYSEWFYPYPWRELKLSEFPNLASYAQGFPTNITFSEGIGFLTRSTPEIHAPFEITAHEAAHQWWGNIISPARGPGGAFLNEGISHFSTILLVEQVHGLAARIDFCKRLEASYAQARRADSERSLAKVQGERPDDTTTIYDKGGWVCWMLLNHLGRERMLLGIHEYFKRYHANPDHPTVHDLLAVLRGHASDPAAFDAFTHQWFYVVAVPEYRLSDAKKSQTGTRFVVTARIQNVKTGAMPVEIAVVRGERFDAKGMANPAYQEARTTVTLGAGETKDLRVECSFEPERIVVDPDAKVLQLERKAAQLKF